MEYPLSLLNVYTYKQANFWKIQVSVEVSINIILTNTRLRLYKTVSKAFSEYIYSTWVFYFVGPPWNIPFLIKSRCIGLRIAVTVACLSIS